MIVNTNNFNGNGNQPTVIIIIVKNYSEIFHYVKSNEWSGRMVLRNVHLINDIKAVPTIVISIKSCLVILCFGIVWYYHKINHFRNSDKTFKSNVNHLLVLDFIFYIENLA